MAGSSNDTDGKTWSDINACTEKTHKCDTICSNTDGCYSCLCNGRYLLKDDMQTSLLIQRCVRYTFYQARR
ncbi:hypothetical protein LSAT2_024282 [Lamellibrachia satsuma]|nr:hypothetical protein LSAT2_024282 [Lamellibrachia satsuma]